MQAGLVNKHVAASLSICSQPLSTHHGRHHRIRISSGWRTTRTPGPRSATGRTPPPRWSRWTTSTSASAGPWRSPPSWARPPRPSTSSSTPTRSWPPSRSPPWPRSGRSTARRCWPPRPPTTGSRCSPTCSPIGWNYSAAGSGGRKVPHAGRRRGQERGGARPGRLAAGRRLRQAGDRRAAQGPRSLGRGRRRRVAAHRHRRLAAAAGGPAGPADRDGHDVHRQLVLDPVPDHAGRRRRSSSACRSGPSSPRRGSDHDSDVPTDRPITREDLRAGFAGIQGEVTEKAEDGQDHDPGHRRRRGGRRRGPRLRAGQAQGQAGQDLHRDPQGVMQRTTDEMGTAGSRAATTIRRA